MVVDTHVHYGIWSKADNYPVEELLAAAAEAGVDRVVQVTNSKSKYDNSVSLAGAEKYPDRIVGVIGRFDPLAPDVEGRIKAFIAQPKMLAIRLTVGRDSDWLKGQTLDAFFAAAERSDVAVQLQASYQIPEMHAIAKRFPGIRFLIDHMAVSHAKTGGAVEAFREWPQLIALGKEPNVWIKVSYFPEAVQHFESYPYPAARGHFRSLYEAVGPDKLIWGSNYPPVGAFCTYREAVDFVRVQCDFLPSGDREAIMGQNFLDRFGGANK